MQDRFQANFSERARQSEAAKLANLEAFKTALAPNSQNNAESDIQSPEMPLAEATASTDSKVSSDPKPLLRWVPKRARTPLLVATASVAALGAAACASGSSSEVTQAPTHQGQVLGENVTPVPSASENGQKPKEFRQAPDFTLTDTRGNKVSLSDFAGKRLVIEFAEGGCPPCNYETKKLAALKKNYGPGGFEAIVVSNERDANFDSSLQVLIDPTFKVATAYQANTGAPIAVFVDQNGNIIYRGDRGYDNSNDGSDLVKLVNAFMAGQDLDTVLPTLTPAPTFTPLPTRAPESEQNDSAEVIDLGNFDLGVVGWQEYTNVMPNTRGGVAGYTKHVVVRTIARNKTDKWQEYTGIKPNYDGNINIELDDKDGNQLNYGPGSIPVVLETIVPLDYEGVFSDPFVPYVRDGTNRSVDYLYQPDHRPLKLIPPGFGLPVFIDFEIPVQVNDYNLKFGISYQGNNETKVIKKGQKADNFGLIAPNAEISPASESLDAKIKDVGDYSIKILGSTKGNMVPGTAPHDLLLFDVTNKMPLQKYPFGLSIGLIYLKDGRVVSLEKGNPSVPASSDTVVGMYLGSEDPHADFSHTPAQDIDRTFNFDLKGAVLVLAVFGDWKAWQIPEDTNVPVGNGGE